MRSTAEVVKIREAFAWIENQRDSTDAPMMALRSVTRDGKPVLLDAAETRLLAQRLDKLADVLESLSEEQKGRVPPGEG
ncbi:MAG: hypothetical protein AAF799_30635 [Myxococcota bacterium]